MITVIVPFSRPQFFDNVVENFQRQTYPDKKLIVVENGEGIGYFQDLGCIVLTSGRHHALAKNEAINWMKRHDGGWWVTMDDDDYYGPHYLAEVAENTSKADVLGKRDRFFSDTKSLFLMERRERIDSVGLLGATLAARSEDSCELKKETHDDMLFVDDMAAQGAKIRATSKFHFIHYRYPGVLTSLRLDAREIAQNALDAGYRVLEWDTIPLDIVNEVDKIEGFTEVKLDRSSPPAWLKNPGLHLPSRV